MSYVQKVKHCVTGSVTLEIEGFFIEKFINNCKLKFIKLSNLERLGNTLIKVEISISDYKYVVKLAKSCKCKCKIKSKKGLPFILHRYRKRKIFFVCLVSVFLLIFSMSLFVWNIEIYGNSIVSKDEILEILKTQGIQEGKLKSKINIKNTTQKIRMEKPKIAWVGIKVSGTCVNVEVVEAEEKPKVIDKDEICNIVSKKDAIIVKGVAQNGTIMVNEGDSVKARRCFNCWLA